MNFLEIDLKEQAGEWSMSNLQSHDYFELYFLLEGTRRLFLGEKIITVNAPSLCVIPPFCMHKTEGGAYKRININVSPDLLSENELAYLNKLSKVMLYKLDTEALGLFLSVLESARCCQPTPVGSYLSRSYLHVLLHLLNL